MNADQRGMAATLLDRCVIERPSTDRPTVDPETNLATPAARTPVWDGPCSGGAVAAAVVQFGAMTGTAYSFVVRLPADVAPLQLDDVIRWTAVRPGGNTNLVGVEVAIVELPEKATVLLRRANCTIVDQRKPTQ